MAGPYKMKGSPMQRNFGAPFKKDTEPKLPVNDSDNTRVNKAREITVDGELNDEEKDKKNQVEEKTYSPRLANQGDFTSETDSLPSNYNSQSANIDHDLQTKADFKGRSRNTQSRDSMTRIMKYEKGMVSKKKK